LVFSLVGPLNIPAAIEILLLPMRLKNKLAPHFLQNPLLAPFEDLNHFNVFFLKI